MSISKISDHPRYDDTQIVVHHFFRLIKSIKRDIRRLVSYEDQMPSGDVEILMRKCKQQVLKKLEYISDVRYERRNLGKSGYPNQKNGSMSTQESKQWNEILHTTLILSKACGNPNTPKFRESFLSLLMADSQDRSSSGIHFLQAYMRIVARIPQSQVNLPFKP